MGLRLDVLADVWRALPRGVARGPVAVLSLHSHRDRSFLDDVVLHEASGGLRSAGIEGDLLVACITEEADEAALHDALRAYPTVVYERVWSVAVVERMRAALPGAFFVRLQGEHDIDAPCDVQCSPGALVSVLAHVLDREVTASPRARPNLTPRYVSERDRPARPSYPIKGSSGCPYSADARENPIFAGVSLPAGMGRGCSFCTTGNAYEHQKPRDALDGTLDQLRFVRSEAPDIETLVLRDQNPFAYLTELVEAAEAEKLGPFTLLVESRADWWLQNGKRFERALASAKRSSITIAPFLVGVENFSQRELDRFNKGIDAELNVRFLHTLRAWAAAFAPAVDLTQGAFGFILFTPWTTVDDLRINLRGIEETRLHEMRGRFLLSRARLYPDTALHYLAERDGLLVDAYRSQRDDASARYGYLPARPWRFADPIVARIAELAPIVLERRGHRDELEIFRALLDVCEHADFAVEDVEARIRPPRRVLERDLARILVRAPEVPIALPMFGVSLEHVGVEASAVVLSFDAGKIRIPRAGEAVVDGEGEALPRIAARLRRSITPELWARCAPLIDALS
jgi:hypothetical protein